MHIACALLLFGIVRRTLAGLAARSADGTALVAALLWMLHPLQSEAVDYITQRSESLMALFFLLTLYCAIRARQNHGTRASTRQADRAPLKGNPASTVRWQTLSVVACACGMASKESMVVAPLIVVLYDRAFEFAVDPRSDPGAGVFLRRAGGDLDRARRVHLAAAAIDRRTVYRGRTRGPTC